MAYDVALVKRIEALLRRRKGVRQQAMFGGICFMVNGHTCCGVERNRLMVRVGPEAYEAALARPHAKPMDFTGRPMRGFIFVQPEGLRGEKALKSWLDLSLRYAASLPPKRTKRAGKRAE